MSGARIPYDFQEFIGFITQFGHALIDKGSDDEVLVEFGKKLLEKVEQLNSLDEEAKSLSAKKIQVNEKKYALKDEIRDDASHAISYLEYKTSKSSSVLRDFNVKPYRS